MAVITRSTCRTAGFIGSAALTLATSFVAQPVATVSAATTASAVHAISVRASQRVMVVLKAPCPFRVGTPVGTACAAEAPVLSELKADGATVLATTTLVDSITALVSPALARALRSSPAISQVIPDTAFGSSPPAPATSAEGPGARSKPVLVPHHVAPASLFCGTRSHPELDPQALQVVRANQARAIGADGSGVTVAVLADGLHPTNADFLRNPAYGRAGSPVITDYKDFSGEGTAAKTDGAEAFGDASSIAAQGNKVYNLAQFVNPDLASVLPKNGCWVKIVGVAPGASLLVLKVIGRGNGGSASSILQGLQYAVAHGAKAIDESFGSEEFPDTALDVVRDANDAAVAAGVTVVVSSGDAGPTSTIGSPASDPNVISVGATTTFRSYAQSDLGGFYNPVVGNGTWVSNNISSLSSGGYNQSGGTVDLVAPGDGNWALCSTNPRDYTGCADTLGGKDIGVQNFGGTSEAAPLTAAAAADVIQAYARAHGGTDPSPALVKQILCSTATDTGAPATEQGAGLLNVAGAVRLAESLPTPPVPTTTTAPTTTTRPTTTTAPTTTTRPASTSTTSTSTTTTTSAGTTSTTGGAIVRLAAGVAQPTPPGGSLLVGPNQVNLVGQPGSATTQQLSLTNTGLAVTTVKLSTRALTDKVYDSGARQFTIDPGKLTTNTGTFPIWSGVTEVYQTETFKVPASSSSRLVFSTDYQDTHQTSVLHVALFEPNGTYAAYSNPQGVADYGEVEVANPPAGKWTALFFTEQNGATKGGKGTSGTVQWDASIWHYARASGVTPSSLTIAPGHTATATVRIVNPHLAGDSDESVVVSSPNGQTTVPVTMRTVVRVGARGGTFNGVLTGGNGRDGSEAQTSTYFFQVPAGKTDLEASVTLSTDPGEALVGYLLGPDGQTVGYSSNYTIVLAGGSDLVPGSTRYLQVYKVAPQAGEWELVLEWENPVTGNELAEPFSGAIRFNQVPVSSLLPASTSTVLPRGRTTFFPVFVTNTGFAPEAYFVDPRLDQTKTITLKNLSPGTSATNLHLPRPPTLAAPLGIPFYLVPTGTTELTATLTTLTGSGSVSFDMSPVGGDPDISPGVTATGITTASTPSSDSVTLSEPEVSPGLWILKPGQVGPYPTGGAPKETVAAKVTALTQAFDPAVRAGTDDLWQVGLRFSKFYYVEPGQSVVIRVYITPTAPVGTRVSGTLYIDDFTLESFVGLREVWPDANEVAAVPYSYTVAAPQRA